MTCTLCRVRKTEQRTQDEQVKLQRVDGKSVTVQLVAHSRNVNALLPSRSHRILLSCTWRASRVGQLFWVFDARRSALSIDSSA